MAVKKPKLDHATVALAKRVLAMPPKHNAELKVGRVEPGAKRETKGPASSAKPHTA